MSGYDDVERWVIRAVGAGSKLIGVVGTATTVYQIGKAGVSAYQWLSRPNPFGDAGPRPRIIYDEQLKRNWIRQADGSYQLQAGAQMD